MLRCTAVPVVLLPMVISTVEIADAFTERGFQINPSMLAAYEAYFADKEWNTPRFGSGVVPEYADVTSYTGPVNYRWGN